MKLKSLHSLFCVTVLALLFSCTTEDIDSENESANGTPVVLNYHYSAVELETMDLINKYRDSLGMNKLEIINHVSYKSEEHDEYMISNNVVNHNYFQARSSNIIKAVGAQKVSENIAYNYDSAKEAFKAWLNSQVHRQNIEGDYTHFGISVRENPINGRKYYTNIFVKI